MGSLDRSFDGSNDGNLEGLLILVSLGSTDGKVLGSNGGIKLGLSDGELIGTILENINVLEQSWALYMDPLMALMMTSLRVHCWVSYLDHMM